MRKLMVVAWMMVAGTCLAQQIDLKSLDKLVPLANSKTEILMDESMLKSAAGFLDDKKAGEGTAKEISKNIKGIYLRSYEFSQKGAFKIEDLKPVLDQLKAPNWNRFLRNEEDGELTEIWMHTTNGQSDGLLLVTAEENELTVINLVGSVNLADLSSLGNLGNLSNLANAAGKQQAAPEQGTGTTQEGLRLDSGNHAIQLGEHLLARPGLRADVVLRYPSIGVNQEGFRCSQDVVSLRNVLSRIQVSRHREPVLPVETRDVVWIHVQTHWHHLKFSSLERSLDDLHVRHLRHARRTVGSPEIEEDQPEFIPCNIRAGSRHESCFL